MNKNKVNKKKSEKILTIGGMENDVTLFLPKFKLAEAIPIKLSAQKSKKYELPMKNRKTLKT